MSIESDPANIRGELATTLGVEAYNRLVASVPETLRRSRLRYWQEELLLRARESGIVISTCSDFLKVFGGASLLPVAAPPWTRELFLREIEKWPYGGFPLDETPEEWMASAWEIDSVRDTLSSDMARTVGKTGELAYARDYLNYLSRALPISRQVELFCHIRNEGNEMREVEFRPGFEQAFPRCVPFLPPPLSHRQILEVTGFTEEEYQQMCRKEPPPDSDEPLSGNAEEIPF